MGNALLKNRDQVAQAEGSSITKVAESLQGQGTDPASYLIAMRYVETLKEMAAGEGAKTVYLPYEATGILGSLGGVRELFDKKLN